MASGMKRVWISRISRRPALVGALMAISRSKRPGRRSAGSTAFGRLVAAITTTLPRDDTPSIRARSWPTTRFSTSPQHRLAIGGQRVDLVDEQDGGRMPLRLLEHLAQQFLGLPIVLLDDLRTVDGQEEGVGLLGDGAGNQGLAAAGRAVQQQAARRVDTEMSEQLRTTQRQVHHFPDAGDLGGKAADIDEGRSAIAGIDDGDSQSCPSR